MSVEPLTAKRRLNALRPKEHLFALQSSRSGCLAREAGRRSFAGPSGDAKSNRHENRQSGRLGSGEFRAIPKPNAGRNEQNARSADCEALVQALQQSPSNNTNLFGAGRISESIRTNLTRSASQLAGPLGAQEVDNSSEIFADGIGEISLSGGMVRMDLVSLIGSQQDQNNKPRLQNKCRVILPPEGFLRSFSAMENLVKQLIDAGLVRPRDGADAAGGSGNSANPVRSAPPKSPNF